MRANHLSIYCTLKAVGDYLGICVATMFDKAVRFLAIEDIGSWAFSHGLVINRLTSSRRRSDQRLPVPAHPSMA